MSSWSFAKVTDFLCTASCELVKNVSIWDGEIFVMCFLYKKEVKKEKKRKYSGWTILSRKNNLLRILFILSGITQTKNKILLVLSDYFRITYGLLSDYLRITFGLLSHYFGITYAGFKFFTLLDMFGPELSRKSAFILTMSRQYAPEGKIKVLTGVRKRIVPRYCAGAGCCAAPHK